MAEAPSSAIPKAVSRAGIAIVVGGALIQLLLGIYYLGMAHSPKPDHLPVGIVAAGAQSQQLVAQLEADGKFAVEEYADADALVAAIEKREAYGGVVIDGSDYRLYVASAASPAVATVLTNTYTAEYRSAIDDQVTALTEAGDPVPPDVVAQLTAAPQIVDVVPLPADDSSGSSLGFIIQALSLGGSIASVALGRLGQRTERSLWRGVGHAALLVLYALLSAGVALVAMSVYGIGEGASYWSLFGGLALTSLALTASIAACVVLFGPSGTLLGGLYFVFGLIISGASIAPEMLPSAGRVIGQLLPPGAAATLTRDGLYFPEASTTGPLVVLSAFAAVGLAVVLVVNAVAVQGPIAQRARIPRQRA